MFNFLYNFRVSNLIIIVRLTRNFPELIKIIFNIIHSFFYSFCSRNDYVFYMSLSNFFSSKNMLLIETSSKSRTTFFTSNLTHIIYTVNNRHCGRNNRFWLMTNSTKLNSLNFSVIKIFFNFFNFKHMRKFSRNTTSLHFCFKTLKNFFTFFRKITSIKTRLYKVLIKT